MVWTHQSADLIKNFISLYTTMNDLDPATGLEAVPGKEKV